MKKKSPRDIPDFSRHPTPMRAPGAGGTLGPEKPARPAAAPRPVTSLKPHATSAKSGRRGQ